MSCFLGATRDIGAEYFFKGADLRTTPIFFLGLSSLVAQIVALLHLVSTRKSAPLPPVRPHAREIFWINVFTFLSFLVYFLAIDSPVGAGINAVIAFGGDPIFTGLAAIFILKEGFERPFLFCGIGSFIGIALLMLRPAPDILPPGEGSWIGGTLLSLGSTLFYGLYMVSVKRLLAIGFSTSFVVFMRFSLQTVCLLLWLAWHPPVTTVETTLLLTVFGLFTFTLPIYLFVYTARYMTLKSISLLFFLNPLITVVLSCALGRTQLGGWDFAGMAFILGSLIFYEWWGLWQKR